MKFPTVEEMAQNVAEKALDEWEYKGKTLREWVEIISAIPVTALPATDINVATKDGTDCISRQEAISAICNACGKIDCDKMDKCEKLQLSPVNNSETPNSSDTISRQQAIDAVNSLTYPSSLMDVKRELIELPPAEPKRGWWIEIINSRGVVVALRCSRCEKSPRHGVRSDFCPNCGAKMEGTDGTD